MLIGELIQKTGLSKDTIRYYEKFGLLKIPKNARRENNYKEYPESILKRISVIQSLKSFGFTLNEISELMVQYENELAGCAENLPQVKQKVSVIDQKINELLQIITKLLDCIRDCEPTVQCGCALESTLQKLK